MKVLIVANTSWYIQNFRRSLIRALKARGIEVVALAPQDDYSNRLSGLGVRYIPITLHRRALNPILDAGTLFELRRIYRAERPDVVFHNTIKPVIYGSLAAGWAGIPRIVNMIAGLGYVFIGTTGLHRILRPLVLWMYRVALKKSHIVLFQNPEDLEYFTQMRLLNGVPTELTFGSGVDLTEFAYVGPSTRTEDSVILMMSRILWDKGVGEFVEAARTVRRRHPGVRFQLLGRFDPDNPAFIEKAKVEEWVKEGTIEYLGESRDVRDRLQQSDIVVLPSYREGVPRSLLEGMAMGKALVTTDAPGCRETVVHGVNGLMVPVRDSDALAQAISSLVEQPPMRESMGRAGRALAEERFDVSRVDALLLRAMDLH